MTGQSVNQLLADLHVHRVATMKPKDLAYNINQRKYLVDHADRSQFIQQGDVIENFTLPEVGGGSVVLVFFRFAGCPACNLTLPNYQQELVPGLKAVGASLVAIGPQVPERLREIKERHKLDFLIASDTGNALGHKFGIVFTASEESQTFSLAKGVNMGEVTGTGTWELPMPTAIVIGQDRVARYVKVSPDWLVHAEAPEILDAVRATAAVSQSA